MGLFYYYGLPFYIVENIIDYKGNHCSVDLSFERSMGLLINHDMIKHVDRLCPFDSGGYHRFKDLLQRDMGMEYFLISKIDGEIHFNNEIPSKIVTRYFHDNKGYIDGESIEDSKCRDDKKDIDCDICLKQLYKAKETEQADWRKRAIEVSILQDIPFNCIEAIIVPHRAFLSKKIH